MKNEEKIILIIEDDADLNELITERVSESGYQYQSFLRGKEALTWLKGNTPLFMFLDYSLPDFSGKEFILELETQNIKVPPFVVATGRGDEIIAVEMMKLGARDYIVKNTSFLDMIEVITKQLSKDIENEKKLIEIESELKESNEFSRQIIDSAKEGIVVYDKQLKYVAWNPFMEELTGFKAQVVLGKKINEVFPNIVNNELIQNINNALNNDITEVKNIEFYFDYKATGKSGWVSDVVSPLKNSVGEIIGAISTVRDITLQKKAENSLRESESKYRGLIENSPDAIAIYIDGIVTMVNNECLRLMRAKSNNELIGMHVLEFVHPDWREYVIERMKSVSGQGAYLEAVEEVFVRLDGSSVEVEVKAMPVEIDNQMAVQLIVRDITERKAAENYQINNKAALKNLIYSSSELIETSTSVINYQKFTDKIREISGARYAAFNIFESDGLSYKTISFSGLPEYANISKKVLEFDFINETWENVIEKITKLKENSLTKFNSLADLTDNLIPKTVISLIEQTFNIGEVCVVRISKNNIQKGDFTLMYEKGDTIQNPELVELYSNQVGLYLERHQAEENLKENEKKYRVLFADNPQPMIIYDLQTLNILEANQSAIQHYGYSKNEFLSMTIIDLHLKEDVPETLRLIDKTRMGENTDGISRQVKKNGEIIFIETSAVSTPTFGMNARHVIINDITQRKKAENDLKTSFSLLNATLESTADGILVVNLDGIATIYNQKFVEMWNIPQRILVENKDEKLLNYIFTHIIDNEKFAQKVSTLYENPELTSFDLIEIKDGRTFERFSIPQKVGAKIKGRVWSFRDISERIRAEKEILQRIDEMTRFQNLTVDRELTMIKLKKEINELYIKAGEKEKYRIIE
ncbi:MAG: PAS domain S-box protein [Paludibacter sp.]|nr:PAS domain S-box protein [Paludibacter sp.]